MLSWPSSRVWSLTPSLPAFPTSPNVSLLVFVEAAKKKEEEPEESSGFLKSLLANKYIQFLMWQGSGAMEVACFGYCFHMCAAKVRPMNDKREKEGKGHMSVFEGLLRTLMLCFGGGTCIPIVLGMRPFPFACDAAVTLTILAYWLAHYMPGDLLVTAWRSNNAVTSIFWFLFETMRCNVCIVWLKKAHTVLVPWNGGAYYPIAVWGPIMAGGFAGSFGGFVHNGLLANVDKGVAW